jgi:hypothetical protein
MQLMDSLGHRFLARGVGEVLASADSPSKMQPLHLSSELGVNVFQYWESINEVPVIAAACVFFNKGTYAPKKSFLK